MSPSSYRKVTACRLCDGEALSTALDLGETPLANELGGTELFPLVVVRCDACEHHQLSIAVNAERLWGPSYPYQSGTSPVMRAHLAKLADEVAALAPGGAYLEIASNDGTLVRMLDARTTGAVLGIDPSGSENDRCTSESWPVKKPHGVNLGAFDVILALNVFAHVDDLHGFTAAVKEALASGGVFIIEVGDFERVIERGLFDVIYHEHMSYHHEAPLHAFFARHGLRIIRTQRIESQGGSKRYYVGHS